MDVDGAREFVRRHHRAVLATYRADGTAQLSPVLAGVDKEGRVEISSNEGKAKVRNLRRDPRVALLVMTEKFFEKRWIQVDGSAEVLSLPEAAEPLIGYERRMAGEEDPPDEGDLRRRHAESRAVLIRVVIERAGPKGAKLDPA
jgi:PPOX class probable F420-dependent enzyme